MEDKLVEEAVGGNGFMPNSKCRKYMHDCRSEVFGEIDTKVPWKTASAVTVLIFTLIFGCFSYVYASVSMLDGRVGKLEQDSVLVQTMKEDVTEIKELVKEQGKIIGEVKDSVIRLEAARE